jgi:hypothetical protein
MDASGILLPTAVNRRRGTAPSFLTLYVTLATLEGSTGTALLRSPEQLTGQKTFQVARCPLAANTRGGLSCSRCQDTPRCANVPVCPLIRICTRTYTLLWTMELTTIQAARCGGSLPTQSVGSVDASRWAFLGDRILLIVLSKCECRCRPLSDPHGHPSLCILRRCCGHGLRAGMLHKDL